MSQKILTPQKCEILTQLSNSIFTSRVNGLYAAEQVDAANLSTNESFEATPKYIFQRGFHSILIVIFEPFELKTSYIAHSKRICKTRRLRTCRTRLEQPFDLEVENTDLIFYFSGTQK